MGCGCGRGRANKSARLKLLKKRRQSILKQRQMSLNKKLSKSKKPITDPKKRTLICKTCPYASQTSREKKTGIFVCHKTNRLINNIIIDSKFNCPIKRWN